MIWTAEKLNAFKSHYGLTDKEIAAGIGERWELVTRMRAGQVAVGKANSRLTGFMSAVKAGKIRQAEEMILYFKSFE